MIEPKPLRKRVGRLRMVASACALLMFASIGASCAQSESIPWDEWRAHWVSEAPESDLVARARESAQRDSIVQLLTVVLERDGLSAAPSDPLQVSWIHARVLEGLSNDDPRFLPFLRRTDTATIARGWDPAGEWTMPAVLALSEHDFPDAARSWCRSAVVDWSDAAFLHVLHVEAEQALGDTVASGRVATEILAQGEWPRWTEEPLREAQIAAALVERNTSAEWMLADYARRFSVGPWYLSNARRWALLSNRATRADSLSWELLRQFPSSQPARRILEQRVPQGGADFAARPFQLRLLLTVAETHGAFDRFVTIADRLRDDLSASGRDSLALRLAQLGYKARRYDDLLQLVEGGRWSPGPARRAEWARTVARAYRNTGKVASMEEWFGIAEREGDDEVANNSLLEWGRELESQREFARAESVYRRLIARDPSSKLAALRAGLCLFRIGHVEVAKELFEAALAGDADVRSAAYFWLARCALDEENQVRAETLLRELAGPGELGDTYYGFRARTALQAREETGNLELGDVRGYWSWLGSIADAPELGSVRPLLEMNEGRPWQSDNQGLPAALNEAARRLMLFRQFGRNAWATRALEELDGMKELGEGRERIATLHRLGFPDLATRRTIRNGYSDPQLRYPTPYGAAVLAACSRWSLAPEWSWSIMRRESFFERTVQSGAGAIGLMQFMPATAREVAAAHGLPAEPLRAPYVNLRLGIAHLRDLVDELSGNWPAALAAYNAGIDNARRWQHPDDDLDIYIENIGYRETRDYVKAVLQGYWTYRELLRGRLGNEP